MSSTTIDLENVKPQDNLLATPIIGKQEAPAPQAETPAKAEEAVDQEGEEEEEGSGSDDEEESEEEEEEEDIDEEQENQLYLDEQSEEVDAPLSAEQEAREALDLAHALGLTSTDEAINKIGQADRRFASTLDKYGQLISAEEEVGKLYEDFTQQIESLRKATREGIKEMMSASEISASDDTLEALCIQLEQYLRVLVQRTTLHCEHRESQEVDSNDVISSLALMGRPVPSQLTLLFSDNAANDDNEEQDADFVPMDEEEDDDEEDEMNETDASVSEPQGEDAQFCLDSGVFAKLVDLTNPSEAKFTQESYAAVQASVEDFMALLIRSAADVSRYNGRSAPTPEDVRFAMSVKKMY